MRNVQTDSKRPTQTATKSYPPIFKGKRRQYSNGPATLSSQRQLQNRHMVLPFRHAFLSRLCRGVASFLGACPSNAILLRQTICRHLRRSRPETVPAASPSRRRAQTWCHLFVAPCALNVFPRKERVLARLGRAGAIGCASGFSSLRPRIRQQLLCPATKDYSDRLLVGTQSPCHGAFRRNV